MNRPFPFVFLSLMIIAVGGCRGDDAAESERRDAEPVAGAWRAWLDSPGGELGFRLTLNRENAEWSATIHNGVERIKIPRMIVEDGRVLLDIRHYDSTLRARISEDGRRLDGTWRKRRDVQEFTVMPFHAAVGTGRRLLPLPASEARATIGGRWRLKFADDEHDAVAEIVQQPDGVLHGTILTTTGDYRYLAGHVDGKTMRLSVFDGAHAFLFRAVQQPDAGLVGDFWSRESYHVTFTATRDEEAALADPFTRTVWNADVAVGTLAFPDLEGETRSLGDPLFAGKARILHIFGSWCPNCHDSGAYLSDLYLRYRERGLSVVGLAFELTDDIERNTRQVRSFVDRHGVKYPVLLGGPADKKAATEKFKGLDFIRSYPTTIFLDKSGRVRAIHSGFTGPATGERYDRLRRKFESIVEELLTS